MSNIRYLTDGEQATAAVLNRPIQDAEKQAQYMSQAQYESLRENRRNLYAGSGQIDGSNDIDIINDTYNGDLNNLVCPNIDWMSDNPDRLNSIYFGTSRVGFIRNTFNMAGDKLYLAGTGKAESFEDSNIKFPNGIDINIENNAHAVSKSYEQGDFIILKDGTNRLVNTGDGSNIDGIAKHGTTTIEVTNGQYIVNTNGLYGANFKVHGQQGVTYKFRYKIISGTLSTITYSTAGSYHSNIFHVSATIDGDYREFSFKSNHDNFYIWINGANYSEYIIDEVSCIAEDNQILSLYEGLNLGDALKTTQPQTDFLRRDFVFLESWHELVSSKDFVYPFGNIQYGADNINDLTGISEGTFDGADTYSLFGQWEETGNTVGKGYIWSDLNQEQRLQFASDERNNIYMSKDGLVQVRYRIRVMKGMGAYWSGIAFFTGQLSFDGSLNWQVRPKGSKTDTHKDLLGFRTDGMLYRTNEAYNKSNEKGAFFAGDESGAANNNYSYGNTRCIAIPLFEVQRRNKGAFDPTFNPYGCGTFSDGLKWYETTANRNSFIDCLVNSSNGDVASGISGRVDHQVYDQIHSRDINDLRVSSLKIENHNDYLTQKVNDLVNGKIRGVENSIRTYVKPLKGIGIKDANFSNTWTTAVEGSVCGLINVPGLKHQSYETIAGLIINTVTNTKYYIAPDQSQSSIYWNNAHFRIFSSIENLKNNNNSVLTLTNIDDYLVYYFEKDNYSTNGVSTVCEVIGDPKNYPEEWKTNGFTGLPLLRANINNSAEYEDLSIENWSNLSSYIHGSRVGRYIKLSRKINFSSAYNINEKLILKYNKTTDTYKVMDSVGNHSEFSSGNTDCTLHSTPQINNCLTVAEDQKEDNIFIVYYDTKSNPLINYNAGKVKEIGKVNSYNYYGYGYFNSWLIDKIPEGNSNHSDQVELNSEMIWTDGFTTNAYNLGHKLSHDKLNIGNYYGVTKFVPYLTPSTGNQVGLNIIFKEMKHDSGADGFYDITIFTPLTALTLEKDSLVRLDGFDNEGINGRIFYMTGSTNSVTADEINTDHYNNYSILDNGYLFNGTSINTYWVPWDGNGYGDDDEFSPISGVTSVTDENGNKVLEGLKQVKLPNFIN